MRNMLNEEVVDRITGKLNSPKDQYAEGRYRYDRIIMYK